MPCRIVSLAKHVLESDDYSECVKRRAKEIVDWSDKRRLLIDILWNKFHSIHQEISVLNHGKPYKERHSNVKKVLNANLDRSLHNDFYQCWYALRNKTNNMVIEFINFEACVDASNYSNFYEMHRYMCCVNAQRIDFTLNRNAASFLHNIPKAELAEILLFRFSKRVYS